VAVVQEVGAPAGQRDSPVLQHVAAVGHAERQVGVLLDEQDRPLLLVELPEQLGDPLHEHGRQAHRRLVEHEELRAGHERPGDGQHLLLAAGQGAGQLPPPLGEQREVRVHAVELPAVDVAEDVGAHLHVLVDRHHREHPAALRAVGDPALDDRVRGEAAERPALELDRAAGEAEQPGDRPERAGLPRAVGADQRHQLAGPHLQVDLLERLDGPVGGRDPAQAEDRKPSPRYALITSGCRAISRGGPSAIFRPKFRTNT
jgi:hypothetical protein